MTGLVTRDMMTQYKQSDGGPTSDGLFVRDVPDFIEFMRRMDNPMLKLVRPGKSRNLIKWEFGEGDHAPRADVTTGTHDTTTTTLNVTNGAYYQKWNLVRIPSTGEIMLVTGFASTNALTVKRNYPAGGAGVAIGAPAAVQILGVAMPEGADAVDSAIALGEVDWTAPEIMEYTWTYSHRGRKTPTYETKTDAFKAQSKKKMKEAAKDLNSLLLHGLRGLGTNDGATPSTMGGLRQFTNTRTFDANGAPLRWLDVMTLAQTVYNDVGQQDMGHTFMGNMWMKRIFNSFFQKGRIMNNSDKKINLVWNEYETDFGLCKFVLNYDMDDNELYLWNPEDAALDHFEGGTWSTGLYSTKGWYDTGFVRGDYGAIYEASRRRMRWFDVSVDPADYPNLDVPV